MNARVSTAYGTCEICCEVMTSAGRNKTKKNNSLCFVHLFLHTSCYMHTVHCTVDFFRTSQLACTPRGSAILKDWLRSRLVRFLSLSIIHSVSQLKAKENTRARTVMCERFLNTFIASHLLWICQCLLVTLFTVISYCTVPCCNR